MNLLKKIVLALIVLVLLGVITSLFFLNEAQRLIVLMGGGFGILNLCFILFFVNKNTKKPQA